MPRNAIGSFGIISPPFFIHFHRFLASAIFPCTAVGCEVSKYYWARNVGVVVHEYACEGRNNITRCPFPWFPDVVDLRRFLLSWSFLCAAGRLKANNTMSNKCHE